MTSFDTSLSFFGVAILLGLAPGPDNVFVLMQSALRGRRAGLWVVLGLCTGLIVHTLAVAVGLAAVFAASARAFTVLKTVGAVYLVWLAWQAFTAPVDNGTDGTPPDLGGRAMFGRGVLMNLTNPKVVIFFLAFLPQFVEPEAGAVGLQLVWLGGLFIAATLLTFGAIAWFAATLGQWLRRSPTAQRGLNRVAGVVFLGLASRLAMAER
ncbi:LysE family translocator [Hydrogenophaga sp. ZJX-1]|uniref:LysE family translocator n=1 Tax=Hydrogenophaga sp. ZJX-1 TaxID=3404778 RepID=UPI003B284C8B